MAFKRPTPVMPAVLAAGGLFVVVALLGVIFWSLYAVRTEAEERAYDSVSNITAVLERSLDRMFSSMDLALLAAVRGMDMPGVETMDPAIRHAVLFDASLRAHGPNNLAVTDANGTIIYHSANIPTVSKSLSDRSYFQTLRDQPGLGLLVSNPMVSRWNGQLSIIFSRRLNDRDGHFSGIATITLAISDILQVFGQVDTGQNGTIFLFNADKLTVARKPFRAEDVGRDVSGAEVFKHWPAQRFVRLVTRGTYDGVLRFAAYRQIGTFPLVIGAGVSVAEIYAPWLWRAAVVIAVAFLLVGGGAAFALKLGRELHRRVQTEAEIKGSEARYAAALSRLDALFQNSSDAMVVVNVSPDGVMTYESVNPVWCALQGFGPEEAIGRAPHEFMRADRADIVTAQWRACLASGKPTPYPFVLDQPTGSQEWEAVVVPVFDASNRIHRFVTVARNVTDRNQQAADRRRSQRMEAVGQLTAGVAHDFNNLLQSIRTGLNVLDSIEPGEDAASCLAIVRGAVTRGATLTHQLLAFSRDQPLAPVPLSPMAVMSDMAALLRRTLEGHVQIELAPQTARWMIRADRPQLDNCLLNLALNARDAMPGGGLLRLCVEDVSQVQVRVLRLGLDDGDYVRLSLVDTGAGMTPDTLLRAREPFFTTKDAGRGSGLGLSMVHGFAIQSGGALILHSELGFGTTASIWLPRHCVADDDASRPVSPATSLGLPRRILLVDDDPGVREALTIMLRLAGHTVTSATDAEAAMPLLQRDGAFDLLVTDEGLPGLPGHALIDAALRLHPALPAILITGDDRCHGLDGMPDFVQIVRKPFERDAFLQCVQQARSHQTGASPRAAVQPA